MLYFFLLFKDILFDLFSKSDYTLHVFLFDEFIQQKINCFSFPLFFFFFYKSVFASK